MHGGIHGFKQRLFGFCARQIVLCLLVCIDAHIRPQRGFALNIAARDGTAVTFEIAKQFDDDFGGQTEVVVNGKQAAHLGFGQHAAERILGGQANSGKFVVAFARLPQFGGSILWNIRRGRGGDGGAFVHGQPGQRKYRAVKPVLGKAKLTHGGFFVQTLSAPQDIEIEQRTVTVAAGNQLIGNVAADDAEFSVGQQQGCKTHRVPPKQRTAGFRFGCRKKAK